MRLNKHLASLPPELAEALEREFSKLRDRYGRQDWEPGQLNGGKFAESVFRYVEWCDSRNYTPLGKQVRRKTIINRVASNTTLAESVRLQIPVVAELIADVRNKRDVGHLRGSVSVNGMDANLVMACASWLLAEIARLESGVSPAKAQQMVDSLVERRVPIIEEIDGEPVVLNTKLNAISRVLVLLYKKHPERVPLKILQSWVKYQNVTQFRSLLVDKLREAFLVMNDDGVRLTLKGVAYVEKNIDLSMEF